MANLSQQQAQWAKQYPGVPVPGTGLPYQYDVATVPQFDTQWQQWLNQLTPSQYNTYMYGGMSPLDAWKGAGATTLLSPDRLPTPVDILELFRNERTGALPGAGGNTWPETYVSAIEALRPSLASAANPADAGARQQTAYYDYLATLLKPILSSTEGAYPSGKPFWYNYNPQDAVVWKSPIWEQVQKMLNAASTYAPGSQGISDRRSLAQQADYERIMKDLMSWVPESPMDSTGWGHRDRFGTPYNYPATNAGENWAHQKDIWGAIAPVVSELIDPNLTKNPQTGQPSSEVATPAWAAGNLPERKLWGAVPQNQTNYRNTNSWFTPRWG